MSYATGLRAALLASSAIVAAYASPALAQSRDFDVPAGPAANGITAFAEQADIQILVVAADTRGRQTREVRGTMSAADGLQQLLAGTGLNIIANDGRTVTLSAQDPQGASAGGDVDALIVTAQKREENIQDVPIAISAFSQEDLTTRQIAGGPDLMTQIPNFTFTKTNFTGYSIQIRGIGTQAISATTDAAVAIAMNNTSFIRNRFFEQEFYDLERIEVLRGPQGTLYGRNATAGVVNVITAKPKFEAEARASIDVGNYKSQRLEGMVNIPLVEDAVALRIAGAWTKRDGYATNQITGSPIDGRDLWSTRVSLRFEPTDAISANFIWEHFQEDDDRLRSGKQLCKKDLRTSIGGITVPSQSQGGQPVGSPASTYSQGCSPVSLYSPEAFQTPNGNALPYFLPLGQLGAPVVPGLDPYLSTTQSRDLRVIESTVDPLYSAQSDVGQLQVSVDISDNLTLTSETAYSADAVSSMQDYNRFNTSPGAFQQTSPLRPDLLKNGVYCDPQIGCADRLVALDMSTADSTHFSQEFRLSSDFDGPFNFSVGGNFLRYDTEDKYYVFINTVTLDAASQGLGWVTTGSSANAPAWVPGVSDNHECFYGGYIGGMLPGDPNEVQYISGCIYIDPNPIGALNDDGHNYFLSRNPYRLISYAAFGEAYLDITDTLKLTGGLRLTVDKKRAPMIPSWLLGARTVGYPVSEIIDQEWQEPTGRLALDWKPDLPFTDDTLLYASFAHGYKAGGANPPPTTVIIYRPEGAEAALTDYINRTKTFGPEFVNAFELGAKNTLLDGKVTLNLAGFYYDYTGYQISQIIDRSASNLNFDATVWGLEIEADWRPTENLKLGFKGGYEKTRVADGEKAIDLMDRTNGDPNWIVARPFPSIPSSCILPVSLVTYGGQIQVPPNDSTPNPGPCLVAYKLGYDPVTDLPYVKNPTEVFGGPGNPNKPLPAIWAGYEGFDPSTAPNNGQGFDKQLGGNELPNAPNFTATLLADYTAPLPGDWTLTLHGDLYYQSEAWTRIFNMEGYDKLKAYTNLNLAAIFANDAAGWRVMAYVKNVMDRDSITGAFLNSDDTGLTTNVFLTEPRLYGVRVTKEWTGLPWSAGERRDPSLPYAFTVEIGGSVQRHDAVNTELTPSFAGAFRSDIGTLDAQNPDLDWGDGREVKLTYAPGPWSVSAGVRFGKTNGTAKLTRSGLDDVGGCIKYQAKCDNDPSWYLFPILSSTTRAYDSDEHMLVDFMVGRDFGLGFLPDEKSKLSVGARYGELESLSKLETFGVPDWIVATENIESTANSVHHRYSANLVTDRTFKGVGPVLTWDSSAALFGDDDTGRVRLDWSVTGGALFGKQKTTIDGAQTDEFYSGDKYTISFKTNKVTTVTPVARTREDSVTVPVLDLSLGLSYEIDRVKVGAGYRWERYFDAIDGGDTATQTYDRTIDGPYLKIAVGFGG